MNELHQTILMEVMVKYLSSEGDRRKILSHEYELIDSFQQQLKNKEQEKANALEYIDKLEAENKAMASQLARLQQSNENLEKENKQLHNDLVKKIKSSNLFLDVHSHKEEELTVEIEGLRNRLCEKENEIGLMRKDFEEEKHKLEDELFVISQKALKLSGLEKLVEQQKKKLEALQKIDEEKKILESRLDVYELNIQELEKNKDKLLEDCKKLNTQLYSERSEYKEVMANSKRNLEKVKKMESDIQALDEKKKYWEHRAKQSEEALQEARTEIDSLRLADNAETLFLQEQELNYKKTIARLEKQLSLVKWNSGSDLATKVGELEGKLEATFVAHRKKEEELTQLTRQHDELQKTHTEVVEQLETLKMNSAGNEVLSKEYARVKKDRDELLKLASSAKAVSAKYEELKDVLEKNTEGYEVIKQELEEAKKQRIELEGKAKGQTNKMHEYEKENIRLKERIAVLIEERDKNEKLIKELLHQSETVLIAIIPRI
eukprot:TRINITY_DN13015_c0_g2_i5.p1 TRINITY_DN13015_c0_g2~~TRINITY_DN13015_c0_g2_i5.p1  ORF type:complete len:491 (+),score=194.19 TRINITY_DN13015_c0_g2_i5:533-2005(+)